MWLLLSAVIVAAVASRDDAGPGPAADGATPSTSTTVDPIADGATEPDSAATPDQAARRGPTPGATRTATPAGPVVREPLRFDLDERSSFSVGVGFGALLRSRRLGDPGAPVGERSGDRAGVGELRLRYLGLGEALARSGRFLWFVAPDVRLQFVFGGRRSLAGGAPDGLVGGLGQAGITGGLASNGRVGAYTKGSLTATFVAAWGRDDAFVVAPLGVGAGLRVAPRRAMTLLLGPRVDAVLGVQDIAGPRRISQIAAGGDLSVHALAGYRAYLGVVGSFDATIAGERFGGRRLAGQGTVDLAFPLKRRLRLTLFLMYRGQRVTAPPGSQHLPMSGVTLLSHIMLGGVGIGG